MFQYTHELVLNNPAASVKVGQCKDYISGADVDAVLIERGGEYRADLMNGVKVYVTDGHVGALDKITIDVSKLYTDAQAGVLEAGKNYALNLFVKLVDPHALFEYGYPNYKSFGKQILLDFESAGDAEKDAEAILASILPQNMENDLTFVNGEVDGTKVILEVGHSGLRFDSIAIAEYDTTACDSCIGEYLAPKAILDGADWESEDADANSESALGEAIEHTVVGVDPFATGEWLIENLRFPSYPNIRFHAVGKDNYPIASELYSMISFEYRSPRPGLGGVSGVGQVLEAATRHIYYVPTSKKAAFLACFTDAKIGAVEVDL